MSVYQCVDCELHVCVDCEGGEDSCPSCHTGPRCDDCAVEHAQGHEDAQGHKEEKSHG